ncbi:MAG: hypothetical protein Q8L10_01600 [Candidatus Moranbacteria bacterium]|nr:hypothetical protein [Candidatus Moranbacteria bacterium]
MDTSFIGMLKDIFINTESLLASVIGLIGIIMIIISIKSSKRARNEILSSPIEAGAIPILSWEINSGEKQYSIDNTTIRIRQGDNTGIYRWDDFEYFFKNPNAIITNDNIHDQWAAYVNKINDAQGEDFYLKLKATGAISRLVKNIVIVHTKPDNHEDVHKLLSQKLIEKEGLVTSLMHYQFK